MLTSILKLFLVFTLSVSQIFAPVGALVSNGGEKAFFEAWSPESEYTAIRSGD